MHLRGEEGRIWRGQHRSRVAADCEEGHVAEVQDSGKADHDIEAESQKQEQAHVGQQLVHDRAEEQGKGDRQQGHNNEEDPGCPLALGALQPAVVGLRRLEPALAEHGHAPDDRCQHDRPDDGDTTPLGVDGIGQELKAEPLGQISDCTLQHGDGKQSEGGKGDHASHIGRNHMDRRPQHAKDATRHDPRDHAKAQAAAVVEQLQQLRAPVDQGVTEVEGVEGQDEHGHSDPTHQPRKGTCQQVATSGFGRLDTLQLHLP
ncbi:MAG: hypothetical protein MAG471_01205 [Acidimicrobiaceae bacterium]|nr:hypothetical protein [Acidimicrobiaceae bacterium]